MAVTADMTAAVVDEHGDLFRPGRRARLRRFYFDHVEAGDPMRYVHGFTRPFTVCGRPDCWCERQHQRTSCA